MIVLSRAAPAELEILTQAGIEETPAIIITTHDDNVNICLTIYCRRLRPDVQIICRASLDRNVNTLHRAGANLVMSFTAMVNSTIMNLLRPQQMLMLSEGLNVFPRGRAWTAGSPASGPYASERRPDAVWWR
ncbi:MAG: NAD-binding protein [Desulfobacterales bacterium]